MIPPGERKMKFLENDIFSRHCLPSAIGAKWVSGAVRIQVAIAQFFLSWLKGADIYS